MPRAEKTKTVTECCWVTIRGFEPTRRERETFYIVPPFDADAGDNKIANSSPLARALIGAEAGDVIPYDPPGGHVELTVVDCGRL